MAKRIQQRVSINGETRWISGSTQQELFDAYLEQAIKAGIVISPQQTTSSPVASPLFGDYLTQFVSIYKSKQEALTMRTRAITIRKHILPRLGAIPISEIKTADIQVWFDELCQQGYARASIQKIRHIISPAFDSAVEDEIIAKNPLKSKRLKINTDKESHHKAIPEEQMNEMRANLQHLPDRERRFAALLCYTGMRLEEILGLRWEDLDFLKENPYSAGGDSSKEEQTGNQATENKNKLPYHSPGGPPYPPASADRRKGLYSGRRNTPILSAAEKVL